MDMAEFQLGWKGIKKGLEGFVPAELDGLPLHQSKEEKAAVTRGLTHVGRLTLEQYLILISNGHSGNDVKGWTAHHAVTEIARRGLRLREAALEYLVNSAESRKTDRSRPKAQRASRKIPIRRDLAKTAKLLEALRPRPTTQCPGCNQLIRSDRLARHQSERCNALIWAKHRVE